jgi:dynein heavy chain
MQMKEMESLRDDLEQFFLSIREFRNNFRANAPFAFTGSPSDAYKLMDSHARELVVKEQEAKKFNEMEELFELQISKYQETGDTRTELKLLKTVWDMKALILGTFESWNSQLWNDIKTDDLEDVNKMLLKNLRKMATDSPVSKGWPVYRSIEDTIKNMSIVLPLVNELHSPAMRDRHWKSLAKVCNVKVIDPNDPKFCFEDVLNLKVHEHAEDVEEIIVEGLGFAFFVMRIRPVFAERACAAFDLVPAQPHHVLPVDTHVAD